VVGSAGIGYAVAVRRTLMNPAGRRFPRNRASPWRRRPAARW
jgi:hypothetical protein